MRPTKSPAFRLLKPKAEAFSTVSNLTNGSPDSNGLAARRHTRNASFLLLSNALVYALSMIWSIYVARAIGVEQYGVFSTVNAFVGLTALLPNWGVGSIIIRDIAREPDRTPNLMAQALMIRGSLALVNIILILVLGAALHYDAVVLLLIFLAALSILNSTLISVVSDVFLALESMRTVSVIWLINKSAYILVGWAVLVRGGTIQALFAVQLACTVVLAVAVLGYSRSRRVWPDMKHLPIAEALALFKEAMPLGIAGIISTAFVSADRIVVSRLLGNTSVGWYAPAVFIFSSLPSLIIAPIVSAATPLLSRSYGRSNYGQVVEKLLIAAFALSVPLAAGIVVNAKSIISGLYGDAYLNSVPVLQVLALGLAFIFPGNLLVVMLTIHGKQKSVLWTNLIGLISSFGLNLLLVQAWGLIGAAIATVVANLLSNGLAALCLVREFPVIRLQRYGWRIVAATAVMTLVMSWVNRIAPFPLTILLSVATYIGAAILLRLPASDDWLYARSLLSRSRP